MSQHLITNQDKFLSEVINDILPGCDKAFFLVGYFYFSGFQEIYEKLQDKQLRILVGWWEIALIHLVCGLIFCITIVGIPWGLQHFKMALSSVFPFGKEIR